MIVSIKELQEDIFRKFTEKTNGGDFGIVNIEFPLITETLVVSLEHYRNQNTIYKFSFENIQSYMLIQENLPDEKKEGVLYSSDFKSIILKELINSKYMEYLHSWTDLKIFFEGIALKKIRHYCVYAQNILVNVITDQVPIIEIIEKD
ncbi:hypothetical protein [Pedobacter suwonensis]|uniref:hypothetical protein n=1 Tax=Pedobacter suwonensis TaxID=332999 RepID=UPI0011A462F0|nr:hypothetical protein [Pedobacter suwonensis]